MCSCRERFNKPRFNHTTITEFEYTRSRTGECFEGYSSRGQPNNYGNGSNHAQQLLEEPPVTRKDFDRLFDLANKLASNQAVTVGNVGEGANEQINCQNVKIPPIHQSVQAQQQPNHIPRNHNFINAIKTPTGQQVRLCQFPSSIFSTEWKTTVYIYFITTTALNFVKAVLNAEKKLPLIVTYVI